MSSRGLSHLGVDDIVIQVEQRSLFTSYTVALYSL